MVGPVGSIADLAESFHRVNADLFELRNAIHHIDSRIMQGFGIDQLHPPFGDFSWKSATPPTTLDTYWINFGPMLSDEIAGPTICTGMSIRQPIDHLLYRVHGSTADLGRSFLSLCELMETAHLRLAKSLSMQVVESGGKRTEEFETKAPQFLHSRLRIQGLEISLKDQ